MKKRFLLICILLIIFINACNTKEANSNRLSENFVKPKNSSGMYSKIKPIDDYLYDITFDDYRKDENFDTINEIDCFGCSSVRNGDIYGRNFDYTFNDTPEFVVHMKKKGNRHASIGVATHLGLNEQQLRSGKYDKQIELIPNFTLDGINDCGVVCSHNVVPVSDVAEVTGTNPSGEPLNMLFIPRFVLDNAETADEAIELLKSRNICGNFLNFLYVHIMIADKYKTYIVEFIDNKVVVEEKKDDKQIMTNFYCNLPYLTENAAGVERYQDLKENYILGNTVEGMRTILQNVRSSKSYLFSTKFYSEFIPQSLINNQESDEFKSKLEWYNNLKKEYWEIKEKNIRDSGNLLVNHTIHSSVYNINEKKLYLSVQEDYENIYEFGINDDGN